MFALFLAVVLKVGFSKWGFFPGTHLVTCDKCKGKGKLSSRGGYHKKNPVSIDKIEGESQPGRLYTKSILRDGLRPFGSASLMNMCLRI
jgi:hypothetical protein